MKNKYQHLVVTWSTPSGLYIEVCADCAVRLTAMRAWPRAATGVEYCTVSMGAHRSMCEADGHGTAPTTAAVRS